MNKLAFLLVFLAILVVGGAVAFLALEVEEPDLVLPYIMTRIKIAIARPDRITDIPLLYFHSFIRRDYERWLQYTTTRYEGILLEAFNRLEPDTFPEKEILIDYDVLEVVEIDDVLCSVIVRTVSKSWFKGEAAIDTTIWNFYLTKNGNWWLIDHVSIADTTYGN